MTCGVKPIPAEPATHSPFERQQAKKVLDANLAVQVAYKDKPLKNKPKPMF